MFQLVTYVICLGSGIWFYVAEGDIQRATLMFVLALLNKPSSYNYNQQDEVDEG